MAFTIHILSRYIQILLAIAFLIILCWSSVHHGWWYTSRLTGPVALGVITVLATMALTAYQLLRLHRGARNALSKIHLVAVVGANALLVLMWGGTAGLMLRDKGKDWSHALSGPPVVTWGVGTALALVEAVSFALTAFLTVREDGPAKANARAAYV